MALDKKILRVEAEAQGWRLDRFLAEQDFLTSRSRAAWLINEGYVTNKSKVLKPSYKVQPGDEIEVRLPQASPTSLLPYDFPLDILFEDEDCAVINKPAGLVVHPAAGHAQDTLVNALLSQVKQLSMGFHESRPGIVHRLDRDTSGVLVIAKNDLAHQKLAEQFRQKTVHRIYWALVHGKFAPSAGTIRSYLGRHPTSRKKFCSLPSGKLAITHFKTLKTTGNISWVRCQLETGRTHQIRIHMSESQHPILGDAIYSSSRWLQHLNDSVKQEVRAMDRLALHACELGFTHPRTGEIKKFVVPWPENMKSLVEQLGFENV